MCLDNIDENTMAPDCVIKNPPLSKSTVIYPRLADNAKVIERVLSKIKTVTSRRDPSISVDMGYLERCWGKDRLHKVHP